MATSEERLKILKMIQEGKMTADEGAQLIHALDHPRTPAAPLPTVAPNPSRAPRYFRVRVTDTHSGKTRVNVRLPVNLVSAGMKMGAKFSPELQGLDMEQLSRHINSGEVGKIVDVFDDKDGEHVEVFIE
jgi:hypothetical protein